VDRQQMFGVLLGLILLIAAVYFLFQEDIKEKVGSLTEKEDSTADIGESEEEQIKQETGVTAPDTDIEEPRDSFFDDIKEAFSGLLGTGDEKQDADKYIKIVSIPSEIREGSYMEITIEAKGYAGHDILIPFKNEGIGYAFESTRAYIKENYWKKTFKVKSLNLVDTVFSMDRLTGDFVVAVVDNKQNGKVVARAIKKITIKRVGETIQYNISSNVSTEYHVTLDRDTGYLKVKIVVEIDDPIAENIDSVTFKYKEEGAWIWGNRVTKKINKLLGRCIVEHTYTVGPIIFKGACLDRLCLRTETVSERNYIFRIEAGKHWEERKVIVTPSEAKIVRADSSGVEAGIGEVETYKPPGVHLPIEDIAIPI